MALVQGTEFPEDLFYDLGNQIWYAPLPDGTIRAGFTPLAIELAGEVLVFTPKRIGRDFQPEKYQDEYRQKVQEMIQTKAEGKQFVVPPVAPKAPKVIDLMAALEKSLAEARKGRQPAAAQQEPKSARQQSKAAQQEPKKRRRAS